MPSSPLVRTTVAVIKGALWSLVVSSVPVPLPDPLLLAVIPGPEQPREGWGVKAVQQLELGSPGASECALSRTPRAGRWVSR